MKTIDTLVDDIYELLDSGKALEDMSRDDAFFIDVIRERVMEHTEERKPTLRMSNIGKPCDRQLWYDISSDAVGEPLLPHTKLKFLYGDLTEEMLLWLAQEAGHTVERQQERVELNGVVGHIDAIIDGVLVDVKSCSSYAFKKFSEGSLMYDDSFGYIGQLSGYKEALGVDRAGFLAFDKQNGALCFYEPPEFIDASARIEQIVEVLKQDTPPERAFSDVPDGKSGNRKLPVECSYCSHKFNCWPGVRTFLYANNRPVYLTVVKKTPRVMEIT